MTSNTSKNVQNDENSSSSNCSLNSNNPFKAAETPKQLWKVLLISFNQFLSYTDGRSKIFMFAQYLCKYYSWYFQEKKTKEYLFYAEQMDRIERVMSDARKGFRYFKMLEELQKVLENNEQNSIQRVVVLSAHLSSMFFYLCDHLLWIIQLRIIRLEEMKYRQLKILKNWGSFIRLLLQFIVDWWQFRCDHQLQDLLLKFLENASSLFIAAKGMQMIGAHKGYVGAAGMIAAVVGCWRFWQKLKGKGSSNSILSTIIN